MSQDETRLLRYSRVLPGWRQIFDAAETDLELDLDGRLSINPGLKRSRDHLRGTD